MLRKYAQRNDIPSRRDHPNLPVRAVPGNKDAFGWCKIVARRCRKQAVDTGALRSFRLCEFMLQ